MITYHLRGTDGTEVFTGTIQPPPGSGSQTDLYTLRKTVCTFDETAGAGTYTAVVPVLAGGRILEVVAFVVAGPWDADTALLQAGDTPHADGYISHAIGDLVNTLVVPYDGRAFGPANDGTSWVDAGAVQGMQQLYAEAAWYNLPAVSYLGGIEYPTADDVTVQVVTTGAGGSTGRLVVDVIGFGVPPQTIAAAKT